MDDGDIGPRPGNEAHGSSPDDGRHESVDQRADRNLGELLQELRVLAIGVQVLFAFLLSLPLNSRFAQLDGGQRGLYIASLLAAVVATTLLLGPVAYHRMVFRRHRKTRVVRDANAMAVGGLAATGVAVTCATWLILSVVYAGAVAAVIGAGVAVLILVTWVVIPLIGRRGTSVR